MQWQPHPKAEVQHEEANPLSTKVSAVAAASRGDNCVKVCPQSPRVHAHDAKRICMSKTSMRCASMKHSLCNPLDRMHACLQIPASDERLIVSGPYLQLLGYDSARALWRASVLIVTPPSQLTVLPAEPVLTFHDGGTVPAGDATYHNAGHFFLVQIHGPANLILSRITVSCERKCECR